MNLENQHKMQKMNESVLHSLIKKTLFHMGLFEILHFYSRLFIILYLLRQKLCTHTPQINVDLLIPSVVELDLVGRPTLYKPCS